MLPSSFKDALSRTLEKLPAPVQALKDQLRDTLEVTLEDLFKELNLVTREEFDIQSQVLARTRQKLEDLEQRLAALEELRGGN